MIKVIEYIGLLTDGGAQKLVIDYDRNINHDLFNLIILSERPVKNSATTKRLLSQGAKIIYIYPIWNRIIRIIDRYVGNWIKILILSFIIIIQKPDIIHVHSTELHMLSSVDAVIKKKNIKIMYTCHSLPHYYFEGKNEVENIAAQKLLEESNLQIISLHSDLQRIMNEYFNIRSVRVINNGVDYLWLNDVKESKEEIRATLGVPLKSHLIGFVGRLITEKQPLFVAEIFEHILEQDKTAFLLIVGAGPLYGDLLNFINQHNLNKNVMILQHRDDMNRIYKCMDDFVFPAYNEGFPLTVIEAQVSGLNCFVSDDITKEVSVGENIMYLSATKSANEWAKVIVENKRKKDSYIDDRLDIKNVVHILENEYERLLS